MDGTAARVSAPDIALRQVGAEAAASRGKWRISWIVENRGAGELKVSSVRFPHGQFRSGEFLFEPAIRLEAGERFGFEVESSCDEPPGEVTENAFAIFWVCWRGGDWRIFVRLRVSVAEEGKPVTVTESVTTQRVGFSVADS